MEGVTPVEELVLTTQHEQLHHSIICEPVTKGAYPGINLPNPEFYISKGDFFNQDGIGLVCSCDGLPADTIQAATYCLGAQWGWMIQHNSLTCQMNGYGS